MPIYEYICEDCGSRYERIVLSQAHAVSCPKCASSRGALQLSVFSARTKSNGANSIERGGERCRSFFGRLVRVRSWRLRPSLRTHQEGEPWHARVVSAS